MNKVTIGLDTAKSIFHAVTKNEKGRVLKKKALRRKKLLEHFAQLEPAVVVMESCGASHHWSRELAKLGHEVKMVPPQHVTAYRKGNKNDFNDADAIAEAGQREDMRFVPLKSIEQQDIQMMHRIRQLHVKNSTALSNQIRGLLSEYGVIVGKGKNKLLAELPEILEDAENGLTARARELFQELKEELSHLEELVKEMDKKLSQVAKEQAACRLLMSMPGIGPTIATALYSAIGMGQGFESARHIGAWCGLVPRQYSTGGKANLLGLSKRGNKYLRTQLINGARAALRHISDKQDPISCWARSLLERSSFNKACVALAHKMLRMAWAMLRSNQEYRYV